MLEIDALAGVVFSGLSALVIEGVVDEGDLIRVVARTRDDPVLCPVCATPTGRVHGFCGRMVADLPVDGRRVSVRVRRMACPVWSCSRRTFREQVPGLLERYQRRTNRLADQLGAVVREPARQGECPAVPGLGRAGSAVDRVAAAQATAAACGQSAASAGRR